jgi:hypothetical protein
MDNLFQVLLEEAAIIEKEHPSKDARFFAKHVMTMMRHSLAENKRLRDELAAANKGASAVDQLVGGVIKLGDWRLIEDRFPCEVIALHKNGSIRVRLEDGREMDGWPERTKPIPNAENKRLKSELAELGS